MLQLAGRYADICFIPPFSQTQEFYEKSKTIVLQAAQRAHRTDHIEFMAGSMGVREPSSIQQHMESIDAAVTDGAKYFLISFPRTEQHQTLMQQFAQEVLPSYQ